MFDFLTRPGARLEDLFGRAGGPGRPRGPAAAALAPELGTGDATEAAGLMGFWADDGLESALPRTDGAPVAARPKVKPLDDKGFDALLAKGNPAELQAYYAATTDPARKVKLWGVIARDEAGRDADAAIEGLGDPDEDRRVMTRDYFRAATTQHEIDEEVDHMLKEIAAHKGKKGAITEKEILALAERKGLERSIEMRHGVNLTNTTDFQPANRTARAEPTDRRVWSVDELAQVAATLDREPESVRANNLALREIQRAGVKREWNADFGHWMEDENIGADTDSKTGRIRVYDTGAHAREGLERVELGETSVLAGHRGWLNPVGQLEMVLSHELGHIQGERANTRGYERFLYASGWQEQSKAETEAFLKRVTPEQAEALQGGARVVLGGRIFHVMEGKLCSVPEGNVPEKDRNHGPRGILDAIEGPARWAYAKSGPKEHFAEIYARAIQTPERLYDELVAQPAAELAALDEKRRDLGEQLRTMKTNGTDAATISETEKQLAGMDEDRKILDENVASMAFQHQVMRKDVCGMTEAKVTDTATLLLDLRVDPKLVEEFKEKAKAAMTDEQLENLKNAYLYPQPPSLQAL